MKSITTLAIKEEGENIAACTEATLISGLLVYAKRVFQKIIAIEADLFKNREALLLNAWHLGTLLNALKEEIGHGRWLLWLYGNFHELGKNADMRRKNAERCMKFARENPSKTPNWKNSSNLPTGGPPSGYTDESVRKFMWGYIPEKERPELEGNRKLKAGAHYLSFVNHFAKFDRQVRVGLIPMPPVELFRTECEATLRRIIEIGGKEWVLTLL